MIEGGRGQGRKGGKECGRDYAVFTKTFPLSSWLTVRLHLPASFSLQCRHMSEFWPREYVQKWCVSFLSQSNEDVVCFPSVLLSPLIAEWRGPWGPRGGSWWTDQVECFLNGNNQMGLWCEWETYLYCIKLLGLEDYAYSTYVLTNLEQ